MKISGAIALAVCGLIVGEAQAYSVSYDQKITRGGQIITGKVSVKDQLFRMEAVIEGQRTITIRNREGTYTVMPDQGVAMKLGVLPSTDEPVQGGDAYLGDLRQRGATLVGSETVNGYPCDMYRYTDPQTGETAVWVWKEQRFPVKIVMNGPMGQSTVELSNIQLNTAPPDADFQLPSGLQIMDMGSMMGGVGTQ